MRWLIIGLTVVAAPPIVFGLYWFTAWDPIELQPGKDTTCFCGPLRPDGIVDYVAIFNERWSRGVSVDNNAAVLLVETWDVWNRDRFRVDGHDVSELLAAIGLPVTFHPAVPAKLHEPFIHLAREAEGKPLDEDRVYERLRQAPRRPWTDAAFPKIASWLDANIATLAMVERAMERPRFFVPLLEDRTGQFVDAYLPMWLGEFRVHNRVL